MVYKILFILCNLMFLFGDRFIANKTVSVIVMLACILGIIVSLHKSEMKKMYKFIISVLYIIAMIVWLIFSCAR